MALAPLVLALVVSGAIVEFREGTTHEQFRHDVRAAVTANALQSAPHIRREYSIVFHGVAMDADPPTLARVAALPGVASIHPDLPVRAQWSGSLQPARNIRSPTAPAPLPGTRGEGVTVAVIDTGIDYLHPAFGGGFGRGFKVAGGHDFVNGDDDPRDDNGHGTHVAGIIAAESDELTGIAPGVTLLAYKVLDAYGFGRQSDVIAALERVVDPNGDGDFSDRAGVANLSLGGIGTPDDPQSLAVDAAVAAGVIVCVAAGNDGASFAIHSPGTARDAITVGALATDGTIASFSARGPSVKLASIKPDVAAPGVAIRSAFPGGAYKSMDGTSMATPHVAATCALIRALHGDWTPRQIRSAITTTAGAIECDAMSCGSGALDVIAATRTLIVASDSHFSFGLDAARTPSIVVTNGAGTARTLSIAANSRDPAVVAHVTPAELRLASGASAAISLSLTVDGEPAFVSDGVVTLTGAGVPLRFAWAVVNASRVRMTVEQTYGSFAVLGAPRQPLWLAPNAAEAYVRAGTYMLVAIGSESADDGLQHDATFVAREHPIAGDVAVHFAHGDAPHAIALRGTDGRGLARFRVYAPPSVFELNTGDGRIATSALDERFTIKAAEVRVDANENEIVALQYPAFAGVSGDLTLRVAAAELQRHRLHFVFARGAARRQLWVCSAALETAGTYSPMTSVVAAIHDIDGAEWDGVLWSNRELDDEHVMAIVVQAGEAGVAADIVTPPLRNRAGRDEETTFGDGPAFITPHIVVTPESIHASMCVYGSAGERLPRAVESGTLTIADADGNVLVRHEGDSVDVAADDRPHRVEFVTRGLCTAGRAMRATFSAVVTCDTRVATVTSIAIEEGALRFTAPEIPRASFRWTGSSAWIPLTPVNLRDDAWRADLAAAMTRAGATVDLRIDVGATTLTLEPAFAVTAPRRRAIAHR